MNLLQQFQAHLADTQLFAATDRLLLAISGGVDSVVLLDLLLQSGYRPALAHCDFQLRGAASTAAAAFVAELAARHELVLHHQDFATTTYADENGLSVQMAARELRYAWFAALREQEGYNCVLTAHHFDDSLETFLLNFLRGTGLRGLSGIPAVRDIYRRPLLFARRAELEAYRRERQLDFREDESNSSDAYQRNYLRHHVLPHLYHLQPALRSVGTANFARLEHTQALLQAQMVQLKNEYSKFEEQGRRLFDRQSIEAHPQVDLLLWEWFAPLGLTAEQIRQLQHSQSGTILRAGEWEVLITEATWIVRSVSSAADPDWVLSWPEAVRELSLPGGRRLRRSQVLEEAVDFDTAVSGRVYVSTAELQHPLTLRYRRSGDVFCPLGMAGRHQKLKDFFINEKVDRWQRDRTPLLVNGDGRIIWVVGYRLDERFKLAAGEGGCLVELLPAPTTPKS